MPVVDVEDLVQDLAIPVQVHKMGKKLDLLKEKNHSNFHFRMPWWTSTKTANYWDSKEEKITLPGLPHIYFWTLLISHPNFREIGLELWHHIWRIFNKHLICYNLCTKYIANTKQNGFFGTFFANNVVSKSFWILEHCLHCKQVSK